MLEDDYIVPELTAEERRYRYSLWWVEHRQLIKRIGLGLWATISGLMIVYGLWVMVDTFLIDYEAERALLAGFGLNQNTRHQAVLEQTPTEVKLGADTIVFVLNDGRYDFYSTIRNDSERYWAEFTYYFSYGNTATATRQGFIYPLEEKPVVELAWPSLVQPNKPRLVLENLIWHRLDAHQIPDFIAWRNERLDFSLSGLQFSALTDYGSAVGQSVFTVKNDTAFAYWEPRFYVLLYRGDIVVGLTTTIVPQFAPGDRVEVKQNWYDAVPTVTRIEVIPEVELLDASVYMPLTGEQQSGLN